MLHLIAQIAQSQAATVADPTAGVGTTIGVSGGAIGLFFSMLFALDKFGFLKRGSNGKEAAAEAREQRVVQHEQRVVMLLENIAKSLEKLTDNGERDTREILGALNHRGE